MLLALELGRELGVPLPTAAAQRDAQRLPRARHRRITTSSSSTRSTGALAGCRSEALPDRIGDVPLDRGLREDEGWIDMQVQFLIDAAPAGSDGLVVGRTVLPPGARHERHRHPNATSSSSCCAGSGEIYTDDGHEPAARGRRALHSRAATGTASTTPRTTTCCCSGAGAARGSLTPPGYELPARRLSSPPTPACAAGLAAPARARRGAWRPASARSAGSSGSDRPPRWRSSASPHRWSASSPIARCSTPGDARSVGDWATPCSSRRSRSGSAPIRAGRHRSRPPPRRSTVIAPAFELVDVDPPPERRRGDPRRQHLPPRRGRSPGETTVGRGVRGLRALGSRRRR